MKYTLMVVAVIGLAACQDERETAQSQSGRNYRVECIEGVEYWVRANGYQGYMAPRISSETLTFVRCEGNQR
jgi:uncharacterized lipoprotein